MKVAVGGGLRLPTEEVVVCLWARMAELLQMRGPTAVVSNHTHWADVGEIYRRLTGPRVGREIAEPESTADLGALGGAHPGAIQSMVATQGTEPWEVGQ